MNSAVVMLHVGFALFCFTNHLKRKSAAGYQLVFRTSGFSVLLSSEQNSLTSGHFLFEGKCKIVRTNQIFVTWPSLKICLQSATFICKFLSNICCYLCRMSIACSKIWHLWRN